MKRTIFTLIIAILLSGTAFTGHANQSTSSATTVMAGNSENSLVNSDRKKKRKLKKKVRQAGRVYKLVKPEKQDKKKARKVQRKIRRVINIW